MKEVATLLSTIGIVKVYEQSIVVPCSGKPIWYKREVTESDVEVLISALEGAYSKGRQDRQEEVSQALKGIFSDHL